MAATPKSALFLLCSFSILAYSSSIIPHSGDGLDDDYGPVIYVNALCRHGTKNPDTVQPNDPYNKPEYWPEGMGEMQMKGILQDYDLGKWLAKRYKYLLPTNWMNLHKSVRVVSIDDNSTVTSVQAKLQGMFPIEKNQQKMWGGMRTYPVPVHVLPKESDNLLGMTKKCRRKDFLAADLRRRGRHQGRMRMNANIMNFIADQGGSGVTEMEDVVDPYKSWRIEEEKGLKVPEWVYLIYPSPVDEIIQETYVMPTANTGLQRLTSGPFFKEVYNNFRARLSGESDQTISIYSAFDRTLADVMNTLGVFDWIPAGNGAMFLIELRQPPKGEPLVTMVFTNVTHETFLLGHKDCADACPLSQMEKIVQPIIPDDWDKECEDVPDKFPETTTVKPHKVGRLDPSHVERRPPKKTREKQ